MEREVSRMRLIIGGDKTPVRYYRCCECGTIALEDTFGQERVFDYDCPNCHKIRGYPFKFFTQEQLRGDRALGHLVGSGKTRWLQHFAYI